MIVSHLVIAGYNGHARMIYPFQDYSGPAFPKRRADFDITAQDRFAVRVCTSGVATSLSPRGA